MSDTVEDIVLRTMLCKIAKYHYNSKGWDSR